MKAVVGKVQNRRILLIRSYINRVKVPVRHEDSRWRWRALLSTPSTFILGDPSVVPFHTIGTFTDILKWIIQLLLFKCLGDAGLRSGSVNLGHHLDFNSWIGNRSPNLPLVYFCSVGCFLYFCALWRISFDLGCSLYHRKLILLWVDGFAINGRLTDTNMPQKKCWKLKDAELWCWTPPPPWAHSKLIAPDPMTAPLLWMNTNKVYVTGNLFYLE